MNKKSKIKFKKDSLIRKIVLVLILLLIILYIFRYAAYFKVDDNSNMGVSIQNLVNVELNHEVYVDENNVVYLSEDDMKEYLDSELYYEKDDSNMRRYVSVAQNKILEITEGQNHMFINGDREKIKGSVLDRDGVYYFPISELENVYNIEVDYLEELQRLNIEKLSEEKIIGVVNRNIDLKYKMTNISKNVCQLSQGETVTIVQDMNNGWVKVKTSDYSVGYIKKSKLVNIENERYNLSNDDYDDFNVSQASIIEINDNSYSDFNDKICNYDGRQECINDILEKVSDQFINQSQSIGVKINISTVSDTNNYYKFLRELRPYVNNLGVCLIVVNQDNLDDSELENIVDIVI